MNNVYNNNCIVEYALASEIKNFIKNPPTFIPLSTEVSILNIGEEKYSITKDKYFIVIAYGESMVELGIKDRDIVLMKSILHETAKDFLGSLESGKTVVIIRVPDAESKNAHKLKFRVFMGIKNGKVQVGKFDGKKLVPSSDHNIEDIRGHYIRKIDKEIYQQFMSEYQKTIEVETIKQSSSFESKVKDPMKFIDDTIGYYNLKEEQKGKIRQKADNIFTGYGSSKEESVNDLYDIIRSIASVHKDNYALVEKENPQDYKYNYTIYSNMIASAMDQCLPKEK